MQVASLSKPKFCFLVASSCSLNPSWIARHHDYELYTVGLIAMCARWQKVREFKGHTPLVRNFHTAHSPRINFTRPPLDRCPEAVLWLDRSTSFWRNYIHYNKMVTGTGTKDIVWQRMLLLTLSKCCFEMRKSEFVNLKTFTVSNEDLRKFHINCNF